MGIFYERTETEDKINIVYKYQPIYYALLILFLIFIILERVYGPIFMCIAMIPLMVVLIRWAELRGVKSEIKKVWGREGVKVSGSKWSFSNPPKIEIPREMLKEEST